MDSTQEIRFVITETIQRTREKDPTAADLLQTLIGANLTSVSGTLRLKLHDALRKIRKREWIRAREILKYARDDIPSEKGDTGSVAVLHEERRNSMKNTVSKEGKNGQLNQRRRKSHKEYRDQQILCLDPSEQPPVKTLVWRKLDKYAERYMDKAEKHTGESMTALQIDQSALSSMYAIAQQHSFRQKRVQCGSERMVWVLSLSACELIIFSMIAVAHQNDSQISVQRIAMKMKEMGREIDESKVKKECSYLRDHGLRNSGYKLTKDLRLVKIAANAIALFPPSPSPTPDESPE